MSNPDLNTGRLGLNGLRFVRKILVEDTQTELALDEIHQQLRGFAEALGALALGSGGADVEMPDWVPLLMELDDAGKPLTLDLSGLPSIEIGPTTNIFRTKMGDVSFEFIVGVKNGTGTGLPTMVRTEQTDGGWVSVMALIYGDQTKGIKGTANGDVIKLEIDPSSVSGYSGSVKQAIGHDAGTLKCMNIPDLPTLPSGTSDKYALSYNDSTDTWYWQKMSLCT